MPTPYGPRGGMAFGADELRVLRRALAAVLNPAPLPDEDVRACLALADSVDEAVRETGRLRAFLLADLARYRSALPGSAVGYLGLLRDAVAAGHVPGPGDLAGLRALRDDPAAAELLARCERIAERDVRKRLAGRAEVPAPRSSRPRVLTLVAAAGDEKPRPAKPAKPEPAAPRPAGRPQGRPVPKPSEVFPPRRKPRPGAQPPSQERAAG